MNLRESFSISVTSIFSQKLRSALTLLGVVIGVMTIIATMSIVEGLKNLMDREMSQLSASVFQVQRYDVNIGIHVGRRRRQYRPKITMREVRAIQRNVPLVANVAPEVWKFAATVKYKNVATHPINNVCGGVPGSFPNNAYYVESGRAITDQDVQFARPVVVLGSKVAQKLFPYRDPLGEHVTVDGQRALVVGVLQEFGSVLNRNADYLVVIPITTFTQWWGAERSWNITIQVRDPKHMDDAIDQTIAALRSARGLRPGEENNFAIWHSDQLIDSFNQMTKW
ncbi:MAG TPA: hypothetical protein ENI92_03405, partial [Bacteroidetes bacterium]|nr:hypothetical protein [Bacteroidota bacterium]